VILSNVLIWIIPVINVLLPVLRLWYSKCGSLLRSDHRNLVHCFMMLHNLYLSARFSG